MTEKYIEKEGINAVDSAKVLVLSHGLMCTAMLETARLIGLDGERIISFPMEDMVNIEVYEREIREILSTFSEGSLVLVDLFGGTPFNTIARILVDYPVYGITGVNLPMLLEAWSSYNFLSGEELQKSVLEAGIRGIKDINSFLREV